ncbi:MAG: ABC transporter ATP-binding protein [Candidatus Eisenbacteria bacterium]|nr:ABC transporter ATP-binding protein [Candidatus Eisenbacteria bacterium]
MLPTESHGDSWSEGDGHDVEPGGTLIAVDDLRVRRGRFELSIPRWSLEPGIVVGLVGPNGAGKTTLLETIAGLRPATHGRVSVFGHDPWRDPVLVRSALGFMSDDLPVFDMRVRSLVQMVSAYYSSWDVGLAESLIDRFHLDPKARAGALSKGQGTRLRLVLAMAFRPRVLLLDEPSSGLDLDGRRGLLESVLDVVRDPKRSVVISSHMLLDVQRVSDRLVVLQAGKILRDGPTDQLVGEGRTLEEAIVAWGAAR